MSTPAAIAVYTSGSGAPDHVAARPWRGTYHHYDGYPSGLGQHLLRRVQAARGDVHAVVRELVDGAPDGWSTCIDARIGRTSERSLLASILSLLKRGADDVPEGRYLDEPGPAVSPAETDAVAYVYVFDPEARRLDAFATHVGATGERIGSVTFSPTGTPDLPALDLLPEEHVQEAPLPGRRLSPRALERLLRSLPELETESAYLQWVNAGEDAGGSLSVLFHVVETSDDVMTGVVERKWNLVPADARREPDRVRNCVEALVEVVREAPERLDPFWIESLDPLRRSGARHPETFRRIFRAAAARRFDSSDADD